MPHPYLLSIDGMGGDLAPDSILEGIDIFAKEFPNDRLLVHGRAELIQEKLASLSFARRVVDVRNAEEVVEMDSKAAQAIRRKGTSMWATIAAVKSGEAAAAISAGNTGALMAVAKLQLRTMPGVHRPAIAAQWPTPRGSSVVLDVGANVDSDPDQLVEFAIMGEAYARGLNGHARPSIGLLNIGSEELKGHDEIREAMRRLREADLGLNIYGFVEGNDISLGTVDVVVTDGFTGNVALKTAEGAARLVAGFVREALKSGPFSLVGAFLAQNGLAKLKERMDPRSVNGGVFLGLNGLVVKSHGGTDGKGFASALALSARLARSHFASEVAANLQLLAEKRASFVSPAPAVPEVAAAE